MAHQVQWQRQWLCLLELFLSPSGDLGIGLVRDNYPTLSVTFKVRKGLMEYLCPSVRPLVRKKKLDHLNAYMS